MSDAKKQMPDVRCQMSEDGSVSGWRVDANDGPGTSDF